MDLKVDTLRKLYVQMLTIRGVEDRLQKLCDAGDAGDLHFNKGQEAISVGVCHAFAPADRMVTHHRTIAHQIAKWGEIGQLQTRQFLHGLVAEVLGKATGVRGGRAGEMHISDPAIGHDFSFQLVGTCITVGAGLAWALKNYKKTDQVVVCFFGDAASSNGQFHEGLSLASIHGLPILFVCENNGLAGNIRPGHYLPTTSVSDRAMAYDIDVSEGDGNDVEDVVGKTRNVIESVRQGRPHLLELHTTRLCWHKQGQRDVRPPEELAKLAERDPLISLEKKLLWSFDRFDLDGLSSAVTEVLDEVFVEVSRDPYPTFQLDR
jgi:acetoin:2,6-dichlorophenolindophenol oxidoreductase subunit alpha